MSHPDSDPPSRSATTLRPGWSVPRPARIPRSTPWPAFLALGITFFAGGFVTSPIVLAVGLGLFLVALAGWIGEIRHEGRHG